MVADTSRRWVSDPDRGAFEPPFDGIHMLRFQRHADAVYGLHADFSLGYVNAAWERFARQNGGRAVLEQWTVGANVLDAITGPARDLYEAEFRRCLALGRIWQHDYECSSASLHREYHMDVIPLRSGTGLLVVNTLVAENAHDGRRVVSPPNEAVYVNSDGLILQCSYCRRIQRLDRPAAWDWVPQWVQQQPDNVTGGVCPHCHETRFP